MSKLPGHRSRARQRQKRRLARLADERKKLLGTRYADTIPIELLKS
jgi:hypothetical protein